MTESDTRKKASPAELTILSDRRLQARPAPIPAEVTVQKKKGKKAEIKSIFPHASRATPSISSQETSLKAVKEHV